jgi:hypothetical protein
MSSSRPANGNAVEFAVRIAGILAALALSVGVIWALDVNPEDVGETPRAVAAR